MGHQYLRKSYSQAQSNRLRFVMCIKLIMITPDRGAPQHTHLNISYSAPKRSIQIVLYSLIMSSHVAKSHINRSTEAEGSYRESTNGNRRYLRQT